MCFCGTSTGRIIVMILSDVMPLVEPSVQNAKIFLRKKDNLSFTHEIIRDTTRVHASVLTNDSRLVSSGYLPLIPYICAHMICFYLHLKLIDDDYG